MIDLDEIESAARKPWYCRSKLEDNLLSPEVLVELITRLRQAEKDAARYRSAVSMLGEASEMLQLLSLPASKVSERNIERINAVLCEIDAELSQCNK